MQISESEPTAKPEVKPETKPETKPEPVVEPKTKPEAKPEESTHDTVLITDILKNTEIKPHTDSFEDSDPFEWPTKKSEKSYVMCEFGRIIDDYIKDKNEDAGVDALKNLHNNMQLRTTLSDIVKFVGDNDKYNKMSYYATEEYSGKCHYQEINEFSQRLSTYSNYQRLMKLECNNLFFCQVSTQLQTDLPKIEKLLARIRTFYKEHMMSAEMLYDHICTIAGKRTSLITG